MGLRRKPGRIALMVFRLHAGRKTGRLHQVVVMVLRHDPETGEAVICSAWGQDADWVRNIRARPAVRVQIGRDSFAPYQRFFVPGGEHGGVG
jgi:deazaflavin-dependent oxidoreductase (nitroreductase family)